MLQHAPMNVEGLHMRCNRCHHPMLGTESYSGACECAGLIEAESNRNPLGFTPEQLAELNAELSDIVRAWEAE